MSHEIHETVVLNRDLPEQDLKQGDLGAVVMVYGPDAYEVEFVSADGSTRALLLLKACELRAVSATDAIAVRPLNRSA